MEAGVDEAVSSLRVFWRATRAGNPFRSPATDLRRRSRRLSLPSRSMSSQGLRVVAVVLRVGVCFERVSREREYSGSTSPPLKRGTKTSVLTPM